MNKHTKLRATEELRATEYTNKQTTHTTERAADDRGSEQSSGGGGCCSSKGQRAPQENGANLCHAHTRLDWTSLD